MKRLLRSPWTWLTVFYLLLFVIVLCSCSGSRKVSREHHVLTVDSMLTELESDHSEQTAWRMSDSSLVSVAVADTSFSIIHANVSDSSSLSERVVETITTATDSLGRVVKTEQRTIERVGIGWHNSQSNEISNSSHHSRSALTNIASSSLNHSVDNHYSTLQQQFNYADSVSSSKKSSPSPSNHVTSFRWIDVLLRVLYIATLIVFVLWLIRRYGWKVGI